MVVPPRIELGSLVYQTNALPLSYGTRRKSGPAGESRTRDLHLGKVALYQLSYDEMVRLRRFERLRTAWKAVMLPLTSQSGGCSGRIRTRDTPVNSRMFYH